MTVTAPADGATVSTLDRRRDRHDRAGRDGGHPVDRRPTPAARPRVTTVRASASGAFSATVPAPFGTSVITIAATKGNATGYARRTVISEFVTGTTVLDVTDPDGDDNGPGTYAYPTSRQLQAGRVRPAAVPGDRGRRQRPAAGQGAGPVADVRLGRSAPSCSTCTCTRRAGADLDRRGVPDPQLHDRGGLGLVPADRGAGLRRPGVRRRAGTSLGTVSVQASQASGFITVIVPLAALGTPGPGLEVHGRAARPGRVLARPGPRLPPTPQDFQFGVCAVGGTSPICAVDPNTVPKAMDVLTPAGVSQADELDPTHAAGGDRRSAGPLSP